MNDNEHVLNTEQYRRQVDMWFIILYGIAWADAGADDMLIKHAIHRGLMPEQFVRRWGEKYGLEEV